MESIIHLKIQVKYNDILNENSYNQTNKNLNNLITTKIIADNDININNNITTNSSYKNL
jgi:hypothetical protein